MPEPPHPSTSAAARITAPIIRHPHGNTMAAYFSIHRTSPPLCPTNMTFGSRATIDQVVLQTIFVRVNRIQDLEKQSRRPHRLDPDAEPLRPLYPAKPLFPLVVLYIRRHCLNATNTYSDDSGESRGATLVPKLSWEGEGGGGVRSLLGWGRAIACACLIYS